MGKQIKEDIAADKRTPIITGTTNGKGGADQLAEVGQTDATWRWRIGAEVRFTSAGNGVSSAS